METLFLDHMASKIHVARFGQGSRLLICFHGFGESARHFSEFASALGDVFTLLAIDLPLHGKTVWREERPLEKSDLALWIGQLLTRFRFEKFSLFGYSMGGRISLCVVELMADQIDQLFLAAADGLKNNPWHMIATQTKLGNKVFKYNTYHPAFFFRLLTRLRKWKLLNESVYKFVLLNMNDLQKREQVYKVWTILRHMMPRKKRCKRLLASHHIQTFLFFGKYDRVIPPILGRKFADGSFPCQVIVLDKGHQLVDHELGIILKQYL
ncbi:hypothetical protein COR50_03425 [Chitinophaga caeni]|uniref:AB hydrolase-1 domain-containing protein n=1 Tax=Chitinophaga caeni TaxID=2029983 RepID=A0A291QQM2_9BACT|nr:alpha/beta hydrolase [Chitinophaga caeni]ATL46298.1 hypothetical protein COR50_03425 [Chitinophaga caeni]